MSEVVLCGECDKAAVARYRWPWGDEGACCAEHQFLLNQKAGNLQQTCLFSPLTPPAAPLGRDERTQLHAARLAAEDELKEVQARGRQLHEQSEARGLELRRSLARVAVLEAQVSELSSQLEQAQRDRDDAQIKLNETTDELLTVKSLLSND